MKIDYKSRKLEKQLTNPKEMVKAFGQRAKLINQRMKELKAADNLAVVMQIKAAACHALSGDRKGEFALKVSGNYRLIFEIDQDPIPTVDAGGIDLILITDIRMMEVEDYH